MKRTSVIAVSLALIACVEPVTDPRLQSEVLVGFVSDESLRVDGLRLELSSGSWSRTLRGGDFHPHANSARTFYSDFVPIPSATPLAIRLVLLGDNGTLVDTDLGFPVEQYHTYRLTFFPNRDIPGYGGTVAIPLTGKPLGFPE